MVPHDEFLILYSVNDLCSNDNLQLINKSIYGKIKHGLHLVNISGPQHEYVQICGKKREKRQLVARFTPLQYYNAFTFLSLQYTTHHLPN